MREARLRRVLEARRVTEGCAALGGWAETNRRTCGARCKERERDDGVTKQGENRFVATTLEGFIQQVAVSCVKNGYFFYVTGRVPDWKDPRQVDQKLVEKYGVGVSKWVRARRKRAGLANLQYLRFERFFILLATKGEHAFFAEEARGVRDCRRVPIKFGGYAVSYRAGHACVRIEREQYRLLQAYFLDLATRRSAKVLEKMLGSLPFEPYAPVRRQLLGILRAVNRARKAAGYDPVVSTSLRLRRRVVRPFDTGGRGREGTDSDSEASSGPSVTVAVGVTDRA